MAEKDVSSWGKADIVIRLIDDGFEVEDSLTAARSCRDYRICLRFLKQECPLCTDERPRTQVCFNPITPNQICNSPYFQPYTSYNVGRENLVLDQLIIPKLIFPYQVDIVLVL